MDRIIIVHNQ